MLSIAIFSECYHPIRNGVVVSISSFQRQLLAMGHRVTVFTAHHPQQMGHEVDIYRFPSFNLSPRTGYPVPIPLAPTEARARLERGEFDLIHSQSPMVMGHTALHFARRSCIPLVFTYHTLIEEYTHYFPLPQRWLKTQAVRLSREYANATQHVIVPTAPVAERLRRYGVTTPITVIPTGIDIDLIDAVPAGSLRAQHAIPPTAPLLVYAGRMAREKNLPRLLGTLREVLRAMPDAHLLCIGGGPLQLEMPTLAAHYGVTDRVRVTGYVAREQVVQGMREADLFVFASRTETQGLVLGEAMACGTPVVAVSSDAAREIVTPGVEGLLTTDSDAPLADAVLSLLCDPVRRAAMGQRARARAEMISAQRCTERLLAVYASVITQPVSPTP